MLNRRTFTLIFITISTLFVLTAYFIVGPEKYMAFSLIPIFVAFFAGQYAEKKYGKKNMSNEKVINSRI